MASAPNPNWPLTVTNIAFITNPFDGTISQRWCDVSSRIQSLDSSRGRQYELDSISAGEATLTVLDPDEIFSPTNTTGPFTGNVQVYRRIIDQVMYPPVPVNGAVNLLNSNTQTAVGGTQFVYDPTFESYTTGTAPGWIIAINCSPTVTTGTPFEGTKKLSWSVSSGIDFAGILSIFACIPGQLYLLSAYIQQSAANTASIFVNGHPDLTSTTTTGSYVRLSGVFVADQPALQLGIGSDGAAGNSTFFLDAIQLEPLLPMNPTSRFITNIGGFAGQNGAVLSRDVTVARSNTSSLKITPNGTSSTPQALGEEFAVAPNTAYALSAQMMGLSTPIDVGDSFTRSVSSGWGSPNTGPSAPSWINDNGAAAQFSVTGSVGQHACNVVNSEFRSRLSGPAFFDSDVTVMTLVSVTATGAPIRTEIFLKFVDINNYYSIRIDRDTANQITYTAIRLASGVSTTLGTATSSVTHVPGTGLWIRAQVIFGNFLQAKVWRNGTSQPTSFEFSAFDNLGIAVSSGVVVIGSQLNTGNTNTQPVNVQYDNLSIFMPSRSASINWYTSGHALISSSSIGYSISDGAWVAADPTFVATSPANAAFARVSTEGLGTPASQWWVDYISVTQATASAFSSTGPTVYSTFGGFVERWPSKWNFQGTYGIKNITAVDAFAIMANHTLGTELFNAYYVKSPDYYWPLTEEQGATRFGERSGNGGPALTALNAANGPGPTFAAGSQVNILGDPSGAGLASDTGAVTTNIPATVAQTGLARTTQILLGSSRPTNITLVFNWAHTALNSMGGTRQYALVVGGLGNSEYAPPATFLPNTDADDGVLFVYGTDPSDLTILFNYPPTGQLIFTTTDAWADGKMHHYQIKAFISGGNATVTLAVDGSFIGSNTTAGVSGSPFLVNWVQVGGVLNTYVNTALPAWPGGVYSHVALWSRILSDPELVDLSDAFFGYGPAASATETSDQRISRYLNLRFISDNQQLETGMSTMGISSLASGTSMLDACNNVALSENGLFFIDPPDAGTPTFQARSHRYLQLAPAWTFGENANQLPMIDSFARTVSNGWGTMDTSQSWTIAQASPADFGVSGGVGTMTNNTLSTRHKAVIPISVADIDQTFACSVPVVATGTGGFEVGAVGRYLDDNNYYRGVIQFNPGPAIAVAITKIVSNVETVLTTLTLSGATYSPGTIFKVRFQILGTTLRLKAWLATTTEPTVWTTSTTDSALSSPGKCGLTSVIVAGNTNTLPVTISFDNYTNIVGSYEIPYLGDIAFDYDPTQIYNDVQVTRTGGITTQGGTTAAILNSQDQYGRRSYSRTINILSDLETQDAANWLFNTHDAAILRVASIEVVPSANPNIWQSVFAIRMGDRVTVKRRTSAGFTISTDYFIERIEHSRTSDEWKVTYQMSPIDRYSIWILENPVFSVLGSTTLLGY